jgi:hypothetical protein
VRAFQKYYKVSYNVFPCKCRINRPQFISQVFSPYLFLNIPDVGIFKNSPASILFASINRENPYGTNASKNLQLTNVSRR